MGARGFMSLGIRKLSKRALLRRTKSGASRGSRGSFGAKRRHLRATIENLRRFAPRTAEGGRPHTTELAISTPPSWLSPHHPSWPSQHNQLAVPHMNQLADTPQNATAKQKGQSGAPETVPLNPPG